MKKLRGRQARTFIDQIIDDTKIKKEELELRMTEMFV